MMIKKKRKDVNIFVAWKMLLNMSPHNSQNISSSQETFLKLFENYKNAPLCVVDIYYINNFLNVIINIQVNVSKSAIST